MPETPNGLDIVQVIKQEWTSLGGGEGSDWAYSVPLNAVQDAPEFPAVFFVDVGRRNRAIAIWPDGSNLRFRDITNPGTDGKGYTLTEVLAGIGGLTETGHKVLRQLIHWIPDGPGDGFSTSPYKEIVWSGAFKDSEIWWESSDKLKKLFEHTMTWTGVNKTGEIWTLYKTDGSSPHARATDAITYSGVFPQTRTRTFTVWP